MECGLEERKCKSLAGYLSLQGALEILSDDRFQWAEILRYLPDLPGFPWKVCSSVVHLWPSERTRDFRAPLPLVIWLFLRRGGEIYSVAEGRWIEISRFFRFLSPSVPSQHRQLPNFPEVYRGSQG